MYTKFKKLLKSIILAQKKTKHKTFFTIYGKFNYKYLMKMLRVMVVLIFKIHQK